MRGNSDRFYVKDGLGSDLLCIEDKDLIRQWKKVMRLKEGDVVRLFDGSGWEGQFSISNFQFPKKADLKLIDKKYFDEKERKIYLGFGVLKDQARMEWMVEKCTELGVGGFVPLLTKNCQVKIRREETHNCASVHGGRLKKQERLEKKILEACEQSGRVRVPGIKSIMSVEEVCNLNGWNVVVMDQLKIKNEKLKMNNENFENKNNKSILVLVGPEGGWSEDEIKYFENKKYEFLSLSDNVLRAETAAMMGVGYLRNI